MATKKRVTKKSKGKQRLDRPPVRIYVTLDELGANKASAKLADAKKDADADVDIFGETRIYEYRLVDASARATIGEGVDPS